MSTLCYPGTTTVVPYPQAEDARAALREFALDAMRGLDISDDGIKFRANDEALNDTLAEVMQALDVRPVERLTVLSKGYVMGAPLEGGD